MVEGHEDKDGNVVTDGVLHANKPWKPELQPWKPELNPDTIKTETASKKKLDF